MENNHEYIETFLKHLPAELRPTEVSEKIKEILRAGWRNKWLAEDLAKSISHGDYTNSRNPVGMALFRLEKVAQQKAPTKKKDFKLPPLIRKESLPLKMIGERRDMLMAIANGLYETGEEAEEAMNKLMESQRADLR